MGACKKRKNSPRKGSGGGAPTGATRSEEVKLPPREHIRDVWVRAVEEEDAVAASYCARLCDTMRGAECFSEVEGLDAFIMVAMGQSMKTGQGGLMVALAQALMRDMTDFKVAVFEALAACARWPSLRGRIAGSGVLGVVTATLLAPRHGPASKALMARLAGLLCVDVPETKRLGDARREEEFSKLRGQLISSGAVKAFAALVRAGAHPRSSEAAAEAIAGLAGEGGDATSRRALVDASVVPALLSRVPGWVADDTSSDAVSPENDAAVSNVATGGEGGSGVSGGVDFSAIVGSEEAATAAGSPAGATSGDVAEVVAVDPSDPGAGGDTAEKKTDGGGNAAASEAAAASDGEGSGDEDAGESALVSNLRALAALAAADGEGATELRAQLVGRSAIDGLRALVADGCGRRAAAEEALRCLVAISRRPEANCAVWPITGVDESLSEDLSRLVVRGSYTVLDALAELLTDKRRASCLGDLRSLRRVLAPSTPKAGVVTGKASAAAWRALQSLSLCGQCGKASETSLLVCTGCRAAEYCSRDCQKAAWKLHKVSCGKKKS
eukprot:TRINITY_DN46165_c0_g1_i1.p1 TRINITY_DN46165_c0_g1~~TRINITY_DN46165_c0_g1_i1.p1  ORF type:complete len:556 (+),score=119.44 TRINITY_DN46165_c0_g1_i1:70-1737(+)